MPESMPRSPGPQKHKLVVCFLRSGWVTSGASGCDFPGFDGVRTAVRRSRERRVGTLSRGQRVAEAVHAQAEGGGQARIRFTMLAVTAPALLASQVGLEAVLGAFLAGGLARLLDPDPRSQPSGIPDEAGRDRFRIPGPGVLVTSGIRLKPARRVRRSFSPCTGSPGAGPCCSWCEPCRRGRFDDGSTPVSRSPRDCYLPPSLPFLLVAAEIGQNAGFNFGGSLNCSFSTNSASDAMKERGLLPLPVAPPSVDAWGVKTAVREGEEAPDGSVCRKTVRGNRSAPP